jgi:hypothetical protein
MKPNKFDVFIHKLFTFSQLSEVTTVLKLLDGYTYRMISRANVYQGEGNDMDIRMFVHLFGKMLDVINKKTGYFVENNEYTDNDWGKMCVSRIRYALETG